MENFIYFKRKPTKCPHCDFKPLGTILYGHPILNNELKDKVVVVLMIMTQHGNVHHVINIFIKFKKTIFTSTLK